MIGGFSCKPTIYFENSNSISCLAVHGTSEPTNDTLVDGNVWIKTYSGGLSNADMLFTFFDCKKKRKKKETKRRKKEEKEELVF